ncbi:hypothetical protein [Salinihabitans flavidus]|nr:hypothetical protein [Salinihabitans flavidus]
MSRSRWHILRDDASLTMTRRLPVRFDLAVETVFPRVGRLRLARQIRQDMWRELQGLRGFAPAVRVTDEGGTLRVTAGGAVQAPFASKAVEERLAALLADPARRARWCTHAARKGAR